jgi:thiol-disulfide isomerase/thioredoxin
MLVCFKKFFLRKSSKRLEMVHTKKLKKGRNGNGFGRKTRKASRKASRKGNKSSNQNNLKKMIENFIDVRSKNEIPAIESLFSKGPSTYVLIYADWCPHCVEYKPTWMNLANMPGRNVNMACVHYNMQETIPQIKDAKINGYPSVIKVLPSGKVEEYTDNENGETTNVIPTNIRDIESMKKEISNAPNSERISAKNLFGEELKEAAEAATAQSTSEITNESTNKSTKSRKPKITREISSQKGIQTTKDIFETNLRLANQRGGARRAMALAFSGGGEGESSLFETLGSFVGNLANKITGSSNNSSGSSESSPIEPVSNAINKNNTANKNKANESVDSESVDNESVDNELKEQPEESNNVPVTEEFAATEGEQKIDE